VTPSEEGNDMATVAQTSPTRGLPHGPALYLLHLEAKVADHAGHYLGETDDLARRISGHRRGKGAKLLAAARRLGIGWRIVRTWEAPADRRARLDLERRLKARHGPTLCPACNARALSNGTLTRVRVAAVAWPRPRRYGRYLGPGETVGGHGAPSTLARPFLAPAAAGDDADDPWGDA
jgi:predicted GIY-YIG superfamily endonuclease